MNSLTDARRELLPDDEGTADSSTEKLPTKDSISRGNIHLSVYLSYFKSMGWGACGLILFSTFFMQLSAIVMSAWLAYWASNQSSFSAVEFLSISSGIVSADVIFAFLRSFVFAAAGLRAADRIYSRLATAVFFSPLSFLETTSAGSLSNRLGKDTNTVDDQLPFMLNIVLAQIFSLLGSIAVMIYSDPFVILFLILVGVAYFRFVQYHYLIDIGINIYFRLLRLQKFYRVTSRELKRLDSSQRSPLFALFLECVNNSVTLRSLGPSCLSCYYKKMLVLVDDTLRVNMSVMLAAQWLGLRLQLLSAFVNGSFALIVILNAMFKVFSVSPGLAGLSLIYSFSIVGTLNGLVGSLSETEQEMISVERIMEFDSNESEYPNKSDESATKKWRCFDVCRHWCGVGRKQKYTAVRQDEASDVSITTAFLQSENSDIEAALNPLRQRSDLSLCIEMSRVNLKYPSAKSFSLRDFSLSVRHGSRVAVVGRTGSGKSSLLRLLLRMDEYEYSSNFSSSFARLCGSELRSMSKLLLRRELVGLVPQSPFIFAGKSLRFNLDPYGETREEQLIAVLQQCRLAGSIKGNLPLGEKDRNLAFKELLDSQIDDISIKESKKRGDARPSSTVRDEISPATLSLSAGQKQLVSLGRALLRGSCRLLLVDELTASIDLATEALLYEALKEHCEHNGTTLLVVCHKLQSVNRLCNQVQSFIFIKNSL